MNHLVGLAAKLESFLGGQGKPMLQGLDKGYIEHPRQAFGGSSCVLF